MNPKEPYGTIENLNKQILKPHPSTYCWARRSRNFLYTATFAQLWRLKFFSVLLKITQKVLHIFAGGLCVKNRDKDFFNKTLRASMSVMVLKNCGSFLCMTVVCYNLHSYTWVSSKFEFYILHLTNPFSTRGILFYPPPSSRNGFI